jgi:hypothetical protein
MRAYKVMLSALVLLLASVSLQACAASQPQWKSSSGGCMALKAQQMKLGNIAAQQAKCG